MEGVALPPGLRFARICAATDCPPRGRARHREDSPHRLHPTWRCGPLVLKTQQGSGPEAGLMSFCRFCHCQHADLALTP